MEQELDEFEVLWPEHAHYADDASQKHQPTAPAMMITPTTVPIRPKQRSWPVDVSRAALVLRRRRRRRGP